MREENESTDCILGDVTPNRATVLKVLPLAAAYDRSRADVGYLAKGCSIPDVGERVWVAPHGASSGPYLVTGR